MKITVGGHNNLYTAVFTIVSTVGVLTISGVQGFDMTATNLDSVWDVTQSVFFNCKRVTCTYSYVAGLPVYVYNFYSLPAGVAASDSLVVTIDIPQIFANTAILQYSSSKV